MENPPTIHIRDRRRSERIIAIHPAKLYDLRADKYFPAETSNISVSGALLKVARTMPLHRGDGVSVGISKGRYETVISADDLVTAKVVRVSPIDRFSQAVAVQFEAASGMGAKPALAAA